jgi:hypothetical protein
MPDRATSSAQPRFAPVPSSDAATEHVLLDCSARVTMQSTRLAPRGAAPEGRGRAAEPVAVPLRSSPAGAPVRGRKALPSASLIRPHIGWLSHRCVPDVPQSVERVCPVESTVSKVSCVGVACVASLRPLPCRSSACLKYLRVSGVTLTRDPTSPCVSAGCCMTVWPVGSAIGMACAQWGPMCAACLARV